MKISKVQFPEKGLIYTTRPEAPQIDAAQRVALIRKGNALFNAGKIEEAKKIFLTTHYTDGLIRVGDYYYKLNDFLSALQMYIIAPDRGKKENIIERMALVVQNWLTEADSSDKISN